MTKRQITILIFLSSFFYWVLRFHPISYDIGRHVQMFRGDRSLMLQYLLPGYIDFQILRYGVISFLAPLSSGVVVFIFWTLGWGAFLSLLFSAARWSQEQLKSMWIAPGVVLTVLFFSERNTVLFANHPYEIGFHFLLAGVFLALSGCGAVALALILGGVLIHPNLILMAALAVVFILRKQSELKIPALVGATLTAAFYLLTSSWGVL